MMSRLHSLPARIPALATVALIIAVAAHAGVWYFISQHLGVSRVIASVLIVLAVIKHLGWIGGGFALLKRSRPLRK